MSEIDAIVAAPFVQQLHEEKLDGLLESFTAFQNDVISFIHKPMVTFEQKHHCLANLNAIFHIRETLQVGCELIRKFIELAKTLVSTMKELLMNIQKLTPESILSPPVQFVGVDGSPLIWNGSISDLYELIIGFHAANCFKKENGNKVTKADLAHAFGNVLALPLSGEGCSEASRKMRARKGKDDLYHDKKRNIFDRCYLLRGLTFKVNESFIEQDGK